VRRIDSRTAPGKLNLAGWPGSEVFREGSVTFRAGTTEIVVTRRVARKVSRAAALDRMPLRWPLRLPDGIPSLPAIALFASPSSLR